MITFLSPAKNMQFCHRAKITPGVPRYLDDTKRLVAELKKLQPWEFEHILSCNEEIGWKAFTRFQDFDFQYQGTPALLCYDGLAFLYLDAYDFSKEDFLFADDHIRVISPLYGPLKPSDGILPYRLELRCKFRIDGKNLSRFWGDLVYRDLFSSHEPVINLASKEYSNLVTPYLQYGDEFVTCDFRSFYSGKLRVLPAKAKMARGQMARFIVKNRVESPEGLKEFSRDGYRFSEELSTMRRFVFIQIGGE